MKETGKALGLLAMMIVAFFCGHVIGAIDEREALRKEQECGCYDEESCAFAPGVIGVRACTGSLRWGKCVPDPRYRVSK